MSPEEFERIKGASQVLTREELEAREQASKKEKEAIMVAALPQAPISADESGELWSGGPGKEAWVCAFWSQLTRGGSGWGAGAEPAGSQAEKLLGSDSMTGRSHAGGHTGSPVVAGPAPRAVPAPIQAASRRMR